MKKDFIFKTYKYKEDPFELLKLFKDEKYLFFLDSSLKSNELGRFSFIGFDPFFVLETKKRESPFEKLRELLNEYKVVSIEELSPFLGGAVGYFSYDLGFILEKIKSKAIDDLNLPNCIFGFYDILLIIDHFKEQLVVLSLGFPEKNSYLKKKRAEYRLKKIIKRLSNYRLNSSVILNFKDRKSVAFSEENLWSLAVSNFKREDYLKAIKRAKEYISCGDIYQVNLSQRFSMECNLAPIELYSLLREINPASFSAYLDFGNFKILSSSPERFLSLRGRIVSTRPMKGTRPRGKDLIQDRKLKNELLNSPKDKAELLMIVDLERNDLGRVCEYGSIKVTRLRNLEEYSKVFQTTAKIEGILHKDRDRIALIKACFPGGSVTGCPKIRAMEIIEELEPTKRAIYTGSLGYLSFSGDMDLNIVIRTFILKDNKIYFQVGGGIVSDSNPEEEYQETLDKGRALLETLTRQFHGGLSSK